MDDNSIRAAELSAFIFVLGGPVYAVAAGIQVVCLRRARVRWTTVAFSTLGAILAAQPLTLVAWWGSGFLPAAALYDHFPHWGAKDSALVLAPYVLLPALAASAVSFPVAACVVRRNP